MKRNAETMANSAEAAIVKYATLPSWKISRFTPSCVEGRRYIGIETDDGKTFFVEINVKELTSDN